MEILYTEQIALEEMADILACAPARPPVLSKRDLTRFHVTDLLESAYQISRGSITYRTSPMEPSGIMSLGRIWEMVVDCYLTHKARGLGGGYIPDLELERDGIIASLDGIICLQPNGLFMVSETKLRFSLSDSIPLRHLQQVRAYCHLLSVDTACYVSGHISSTPPTINASLRIIRFEQSSIDETWEGILSTKNYLESQGITPTLS